MGPSVAINPLTGLVKIWLKQTMKDNKRFLKRSKELKENLDYEKENRNNLKFKPER